MLFYETKISYEIEVAKFTEGRVKVAIEIINVPNNVSVSIFPKEVYVTAKLRLGNIWRINKMYCYKYNIVMIDLSIYCFIAFALLGSMFYMLFTFNKNDKTIKIKPIISLFLLFILIMQ